MNRAEAAEDLVERSRLGDQNAQAMISEVGRMAREEPNPDVLASYRAIESYNNATRENTGSFGSKVGHDARGVLAAFGAVEDAASRGIDPYAALLALLARLPLVGGARAANAACAIVACLPLPPGDQAVAELAARTPTPADSEALSSSAVSPSAVGAYRGTTAERYAFAGWVLGSAARLRAFLSGASSAALGPDAAWELGGQ